MTLLLTALLAAAQDTPTTTPAALQAAYQKEFAYLKAEKQALSQRRTELTTDGIQRVRKSETSIDGLQARLLALEGEGDRTETRLGALEDASIAAEEAADLIDSTVSQAGEALSVEIDENLSDADQLRAVYAAAADILTQSAQIQVTDGDFFLPDGSRVDGKRIQVGQIGAYGVSDQGSGALLPIGEGRLQLRLETSGESEAAALLAGQRPESLGIFLLESLDKPVSERVEQTFGEWMDGGGVVGVVIMGLGVLALILSVVRFFLLLAAGRGGSLAEMVTEHVRRSEPQQALALCKKQQTPISRVLESVLTASDREREALQDTASEALLFELPTIERFGSTIIIVAAVAPLLGLLGTVTGMIATFEIITEFGTGDPRMLSGGISEALITTQMGLIVAIPAVLLGNTLKGQADTVIARLERSALRVVNLLAGEDDEDDSRARLASK
ncbi:MAG: biopolymer transport protein ExbB [Myxococcota bacterium]